MASKISAQMYTLRDYTKTADDFARTLEKLRGIGYTAVQLSGIGCMNGDTPEVSAREARRLLDDHGMQCAATHRAWDALAKQTEAEIEFHQILGCIFTAIGGIAPSYREQGAAGYRQFAADAQPVMQKLKAAGIAFGYHNHAHEFENLGEGNHRTFFDILVDDGGPLMNLEVDVYWVAHAGVNPQRVIERCAGRVPYIHFKDKEVITPDGPVMSPVGEGNLDWENLIPACEKAGVQGYAVEQDTCRRDPFDCLRSSFEFLTAAGL